MSTYRFPEVSTDTSLHTTRGPFIVLFSLEGVRLSSSVIVPIVSSPVIVSLLLPPEKIDATMQVKLQ